MVQIARIFKVGPLFIGACSEEQALDGYREFTGERLDEAEEVAPRTEEAARELAEAYARGGQRALWLWSLED